MTDKRGFDLGGYIEVKDRIAKFYELYGQGRLVTTDVRLTSEPDGVPRVLVEAAAYRTPDDPLPARGWSWMVLPGTTSYTRGSELENTETSAWGRAIAALGILVDKSIASAQEVQNKQERSGWVSDTPFGEPIPEPEHTGSEGLIGTVEAGKVPVDMELRYSPPDGLAAWGFKLKNGRRAYQVLAKGPLAEALATLDGQDHSLAGVRVTVYGRIEMIPWRKGDRDMPPYPRVAVERIQTPDGIIPAPLPASDELTDEEKALIGGSLPDEAPSEELGLLV